jgi:cellulose synthase/poly-beta-1,6-N-acetylglucosamine synthase-like glycosyltransferase
MEFFLLSILFLYLINHSLFYIGLIKNLKKPISNLQESQLPSVTVIVSARNEEDKIAKCIESLLNLDYPENKIELIVIDNFSNDRTPVIMKDYSTKNPSLTFLETEKSEGKLKGKTLALTQAIKKSKGEIIFTTDADCEVNPLWIREMVKYYDNDTGIVNSFTLMRTGKLFYSIQSFDWLYLLTLCSGSDGIGKPLSCVGNNMSYRRAAYNEIGGYENLPFSLTEDFLLQKKISENTKWKVKFPVNPEILNISLPCFSLNEVYRQKHRWAIGGLHMSIYGYYIGLIGWLVPAMILTGWFFVGWKIYLLFVFAKLICDFIFSLTVIKKIKFYSLIPYFIFFEIYLIAYSILIPFMVIFDRHVVWKKQKY